MNNHTQDTDKVQCPLCGGDGKETCDNPDHGLLNALYFHEVGRLGCPVCGHDPKHKVPKGGDCKLCNGTGSVTPMEDLISTGIAIEKEVKNGDKI